MNGPCSYRTECHSSHADAGLTFEGSSVVSAGCFPIPPSSSSRIRCYFNEFKAEKMRECPVIIRCVIGQ